MNVFIIEKAWFSQKEALKLLLVSFLSSLEEFLEHVI